jgi:hypothetical protein
MAGVGDAGPNPALALGRPAMTLFPGRGSGERLARRNPRRGEILIKNGRLRGISPPLGKTGNLEDPDTAIERDREDVGCTHRLARHINPLAIEPDMTLRGQRGGGSPGPHDPCVPQPFVDTLTVRVHYPGPLLCCYRGE